MVRFVGARRLSCTCLVLFAAACNVGTGSATDPNGVSVGTEQGGLGTGGTEAGGQPVVDPNAGVAQAPNDAAQSPNASANVAQGNAAVTDGNFTVDARYAYSYVGRFDVRDPNAVRFNWPGARIGVAFTGTSLGVRLRDTGADTFDVQIDGVDYASPADAYGINAQAALVPCNPVAQVPAWDGNNFPGCVLAVPSSTTDLNATTTYPIATGLAEGNHVAWLSKRSEFYQGNAGTTTFYGFTLDDNATLLAPPSYRKRRIEFVGDSSFSGFGAGQRNPCTYTSRNCDAGRAIPAYAAQYLKAEAINLSSSGQGVYQSYYDHTGNHNLPTLYRQTVGLDANVPWGFADDVDAVIFSAGGDDLWGAAGSGSFDNNDPNVKTDATDNFVAAYASWLNDVRIRRRKATLFVTLTYGAAGQDIATLGNALQRAVSQRNAAGDANVVYFTYFPTNDSSRNPNGYQTLGDVTAQQQLWLGCSGHPSPPVARVLAAMLGAFVAQRMGYADAGY